MNTATAPLFLDTNRRMVNRYLAGLLLLYLAAVGTAVGIGRMDMLIAMALIPATVIFVAFPRIALILFVASIFVAPPLNATTPILPSDLTALPLIAAALLDLLVGRELPRAFAKLSFHFVALIVVVFVTAMLSTRPELAISSFSRLLMLTAVFLSVYRISARIGIGFVPKLFFWCAALFSIPAILDVIASGGKIRSFGLSRLMLDDHTMLSLPIGFALYLFADRRPAKWYLFGMALVLGGLIATQSRLSMTLSFIHAFLVLVIIRRNRLRISELNLTPLKSLWDRAGKRISLFVLAGVLAVCVFLALKPEVIFAVFERFTVAFGGGRLGDSYVPRMALWSAATRAFLDHPIFGIGPGNFRSIMYLYPELSMSYYYYWVRGFSSHNMLLHYLAETGIVGGVTVVSLFISGFRYSFQSWKQNRLTEHAGESLAILMVASLFAVTAFVEAGWMWGETGFVMALFMGAIARQRENLDLPAAQKEN